MTDKEGAPKKKERGVFSHSLRMVAGLYLVYMAYKMVASIGARELGNVPPALAILVAVVFLASGIIIFWKSFKADMAQRRQEKKAQEDTDDADEP